MSNFLTKTAFWGLPWWAVILIVLLVIALGITGAFTISGRAGASGIGGNLGLNIGQ